MNEDEQIMIGGCCVDLDREGELVNSTQFAGYRAAGSFSVPSGENLLLLPPQARSRRGVGGWVGGCKVRSAKTKNTNFIKRELL